MLTKIKSSAQLSQQYVCKASLKIRQNTAVNYQFDVGFIQTQVLYRGGVQFCVDCVEALAARFEM